MEPVALVREDKLALPIWTVPVASFLVVADHRRHHNWNKLRHGWERSLVRSLTRCISGAHPLCRWQVMELEAILAAVHADMAVQVVLRVQRWWTLWAKGNVKIIKKLKV